MTRKDSGAEFDGEVPCLAGCSVNSKLHRKRLDFALQLDFMDGPIPDWARQVLDAEQAAIDAWHRSKVAQ